MTRRKRFPLMIRIALVIAQVSGNVHPDIAEVQRVAATEAIH